MERIHLLLIFLLLISNCGPARFQFGLVPSASESEEGLAPVVERNLRMGTREFTASTLSEIFGGSRNSSVNEVIEEMIRTQLGPFGGGPCDRYGEDCPPSQMTPGRADPAGESQALVVPSATTGRMALILRSCEKITAINDAVRFAAAQAMGVPVDSQLPIPLAGDITAAFELFYTGRSPSSDVVRSLDSLAREAQQLGGEIESWRFLFLALCISPGWQIP